MTNFKTFLSNLVDSCDQIYGATIMGFDGITLSKYFKQEVPLSPDVFEAFIAEFSPVIQTFNSKSYDMLLGSAQNISATMGNISLFFKIINKNYFLAVVSNKDAYIGKVDYYSSIETQKFNQVFEI